MKTVQEYEHNANKHLHLALHILTQTYPMVQNPKILMGVIENLHSTIMDIISMVLVNERNNKRIPPFYNNTESKINMFKGKIIDKYHINIEYITLINELQDILIKRRQSPVEFVRKDKFVICSDKYSIRTISVEEMQKFISITKVFLQDMKNLVRKHG